MAEEQRLSTQDDRAPIDLAALRQAVESSLKSPSTEVLDHLERVTKLPAFSQLTSEQRYVALFSAGSGAYKLKQYTRAAAFLAQSTAMPEAKAGDWFYRTHASWAVGDRQDAIRGITTIARRWPETLSWIADRYMFAIAREARKLPLDSEDRFQFLDALFRAHWKPARVVPPSWFWRDLTLVLIERDVRRAIEVAREITNPYSLIAMKVDNRFEPIVRAMAERFDIERAAAMQIEQLRTAMQKSPKSLAVLIYLARSLKRSLKYQDSLDLLDAALRQLQSKSPPFNDAADQLIWVMNERSRALEALGRWDEAIEEMEHAKPPTRTRQ